MTREPKNKGGRPITVGRAVKAYAQTVKQLDAIADQVEGQTGIHMSRAATMAYVTQKYVTLMGTPPAPTNIPPGT